MKVASILDNKFHKFNASFLTETSRNNLEVALQKGGGVTQIAEQTADSLSPTFVGVAHF